ncbi:hypothetical protein F4781DRAFT_9034 [Annulohypoxylon bovei var. microspora]|nr:hypothetical protein F4781DRAFT_9034 [Annulohypoxylon bovei var. microspora]
MASNGPLSINGGTYPPFGEITDDDHGSYVIIATWIFACISVLFVAVRVIVRVWLSRHVGRDIALIMAALLCSIGQSVAATEAVAYGLGRHLDALSNAQIRSYYRSILASEILSIFIFVLSKLSLVILVGRITPSNTMKAALNWFAIFTILWGLSDIFSVSFQCGFGVPMRALDDTCVNERALVVSHGIINILTDCVLMIFPVFAVWTVQIKTKQKLTVMGLFCTRLIVCVFIGIQLGSMESYLSGDDPTWYYLDPSIWNQIATHLSVITACVPSIKPFLTSLQSSLIDSGVPRNYTSNNFIELLPWGSSIKASTLKTFGGSGQRKFNSSAREIGLETTTHNEIEGGVDSEDSSTRGLTEGVIHRQREVDVVITDALDTPHGNEALKTDVIP